MSLDGLFLKSVEMELRELLVNCRIDKINQPEKDEIILSFNKNKKNYKLLISSNSTYGRIHITNEIRENPSKAPMFCMILRKYLSGARIVSVDQLNMDRIIIIKFENTDELGFNSTYSLIVEIMNRHSNITLVRDRDNIIMDCIKHVGSNVNTYRVLYSGAEYVYPPESSKENILTVMDSTVEKLIEENDLCQDFFSNCFQGISKKTSRFLYENFLNIFKGIIDKNNIKTFIHHLVQIILDRDFTFFIYNNNNVPDFSCIDFKGNNDVERKTFSSASSLLEAYYNEKDKRDRLNTRSSDLQRIVQTNIERCEKKLHIFNETLKECEKKDDFKLKGELLTANIYKLQSGISSISLENYYDETLPLLDIALDKSKTPAENIQMYYKKYTKLKKSEEMSIINIATCEDEITYLSSVLNSILQVENYVEIEDIRAELMESGYIKFSKKKDKSKKTSKPYHYIFKDGSSIFVGKNNIQNDHLTLKFAGKNDIWMHTKNIPGSHVIIQTSNNTYPSEELLDTAASLAAYYSKGRNSSKVPVDYTEVKNVKKPKGAKPGMVIYVTNKTILASPREPLSMDLKE
ncbi:Predicted component of the ribosome quality control (RQC) complex, YloA/Tae2 family, contains fibronectin-binding (FbpA) and DUF814 domains [Hathewaya proteolytica DSM 3090]|uniref:Rqc2 homolog RqcH n=1 Tax=Hathewaya proteolytica DSM 3090 TaxID=1121331 RepID=A0A1M6L671_9CLOT|nr:NFACT RNA binding domain-containing protein [Hathewaya proteolytica]SHJ66705.1 Predicted component of the ribosome quality control (RQC) complex, YloA/Tae2 family, contains fibronectin-binding (FbpA) and DUF814 domains [Hathewaya proteolytica DSM 3090]